MRMSAVAVLIASWLLLCAVDAKGQADDVWRELGERPTPELSGRDRLASYVYGQIVVTGIRSDVKAPRVTVIYSDSLKPASRQVITKSGNYCFKKIGGGGMIVVDVDGSEVARRAVS